MGPSISDIKETKTSLHEVLTIKKLRPAKYFLGLEISCSEKGILISQQKYINDSISDAGLEDYKPKRTALSPRCKLGTDAGEKLENLEIYRRVIGRLLYRAFTRPDITYAIQTLNQFMSNPCKSH